MLENIVVFNNRKYPYRILFVPELNDYCKISVDSLNEAILNEESEYITEDARFVDEQIFCYIPDKCIDCSQELVYSFVARNIL